ncbi:hypothetical protein Rhopal_006447-T1 [Rhodotorula paludigena]|uniref:Uncharacterized protein n=1 Tax=Rhodotorula paludigena TaxID=86838 RepID=A0AAV5GV80_9BASI|nr:hypothetical protein Rhopal_006447-T1 [Rhodotorula paludigena]
MGGAGLGLYEPDLAPKMEGKCPVCSKQLIVAGCTHNYKACGQHVFVCQRDRRAEAVRDRILDSLFEMHPTCPWECSKSKAIELTGNIKTGHATAHATISSCDSGPFDDPAAYFVHLNLTHRIPVGGKNLASKSLVPYCCKCKEWVEGWGHAHSACA